jgi:peptidyl-dipeptidase Dcp
MLSDVTYPSLSAPRCFTDFVELPSQLYEHWQEQPQVLRQFARHYQTGEPLPDDLCSASSPRENSTRALPPWSSSPRR